MPMRSLVPDSKYFAFLDELRDSGTVNTVLAASYLAQEFPCLRAEEAKAIYDATADNYAAPPAVPVDTITLTVDVNDAQRLIDSSSIFGINHRYAFNGYGSFDSEKMEVKEFCKRLFNRRILSQSIYIFKDIFKLWRYLSF